MPEVEVQTETLLAEQGNKWDPDRKSGAIASYGNNRNLVFLPDGTVPGQNVRVIVHELPNKDSRGKTLYRAIPAPPLAGERWKDNGDGTATCVKISTDWLMNVSEVGVVETRPLQSCENEGAATSRTDRVIVWGADLATSAVVEEVVRVIPSEREEVEHGGVLIWERTGQREDHGQAETRPVVGVTLSNVRGMIYPNRYKVTYDDGWPAGVNVRFVSFDGANREITTDDKWGDLPAWLQCQIEIPYPVCTCGRSRMDAVQVDGYKKCSTCRKEERCERCGKQPVEEVKNFSGRLICAACQPLEEQEKLIWQHVSDDRRRELASLAESLLAGKAMPQELGELVLTSTLDHVESDWTRRDLVQKYAGYAWYYFTDDGVYGSKFSPEALEILCHLAEAQGNGLVRLIAWLTGYQKAADCERNSDFYWRSQVKSEDVQPALTESKVGSLDLVVRLRGSEADRQAATNALRQLEAREAETGGLSNQADEVDSVRHIIGRDDFSLARSRAEEALTLPPFDLHEAVKREWSTCPLCGEDVYFNPDVLRYGGEVAYQCDCLRTEQEVPLDKSLRAAARPGHTHHMVVAETYADGGAVVAELTVQFGNQERHYARLWVLPDLPARAETIGTRVLWPNRPRFEYEAVPEPPKLDKRAVKFRPKGRIGQPDEHVDTGSSRWHTDEEPNEETPMARALRLAKERKGGQ